MVELPVGVGLGLSVGIAGNWATGYGREPFHDTVVSAHECPVQSAVANPEMLRLQFPFDQGGDAFAAYEDQDTARALANMVVVVAVCVFIGVVVEDAEKEVAGLLCG